MDLLRLDFPLSQKPKDFFKAFNTTSGFGGIVISRRRVEREFVPVGNSEAAQTQREEIEKSLIPSSSEEEKKNIIIPPPEELKKLKRLHSEEEKQNHQESKNFSKRLKTIFD